MQLPVNYKTFSAAKNISLIFFCFRLDTMISEVDSNEENKYPSQ